MSLGDVLHKATHSLARFTLELEANYKQLKTASRLRARAAQRLETQRAAYEEDRSSVDRYLDAVSQYANAAAQETQCKMNYNMSITALEEAKGTLLQYDKIIVVEGPRPRTAAGTRAREAAKVGSPAPLSSPAAPSEPAPSRLAAAAKDGSHDTEASGKTFSFQLTLSAGPKPVEIRGSFTITPICPVDSSKAR